MKWQTVAMRRGIRARLRFYQCGPGRLKKQFTFFHLVILRPSGIKCQPGVSIRSFCSYYVKPGVILWIRPFISQMCCLAAAN